MTFNSVVHIYTGPLSQQELESRKDTVRENIKGDNYKDLSDEEKERIENNVQQAFTNIENSNKYFYSLTVKNLIIGIVGLLGVLMMFNLDRRGFGLYVASCLIWVAGPALFISMSNFVQVQMVLTGVVSTSFIFMYGMNLKYMNLKYF